MTDRIRSALRSASGVVGSGFRMLGSGARRAGGFLRRQVSGARENFGRAWGYLTFDNILPPSLVDLGQWLIETFPKLLGIRSTSPWQQVGAAISVIGFAILATFLSGGWLIGTVVIVAALGSVGLVRFVPAVNDTWEEWTAALPIKRDYDVPRWKRD